MNILIYDKYFCHLGGLLPFQRSESDLTSIHLPRGLTIFLNSNILEDMPMPMPYPDSPTAVPMSHSGHDSQSNTTGAMSHNMDSHGKPAGSEEML